MSDLFSSVENLSLSPLANRMRPRNLDEYIGQEHIIGKGRLLRRAISADLLSSLIFYGPPGTGKTTLAKVIANTTKSHFSSLNAVLSGVKDIRVEIENAKDRFNHYAKRTILFVDEVHRWNKSQQDALLPWVENGTFILIGATTENPYFEVNAALVSRSRVFQLTLLSKDELKRVAYQALEDKQRGYGEYNIKLEDDAFNHLVNIAAGDARSLLNALQLAIETTPNQFPPQNKNEEIIITKEIAEESIQKKVVLYDKEGDYHFDVISAFIKSIRGSDADAALYWLAKMVHAGEDPKFIFRRMLILAAEDIGLADPLAINVVSSCANAFDRIGLPEGRFHLTHAALYLATCKKSNSSLAFFDALQDVTLENQVPNHLKDASRDSKAFGHGQGYLYPHSYKDHWVSQEYLPSSLRGKIYYKPSDQGYEASIKEEVERRREAQLETINNDAYIENLTFSQDDKAKDKWLNRTSSNGSLLLLELRDVLFDDIIIKRHDNILLLNASHGLLLWQAMKNNPEGLCIASCKKTSEIDYINNYKQNLDLLIQPEIYIESDLLKNLDTDLLFEHIFIKNMYKDFEKDNTFYKSILSHYNNGSINIAESITSMGSRLSEFITNKKTKSNLEKAESIIFKDTTTKDEIINFYSTDFTYKESEIIQYENRILNHPTLIKWLDNTYNPVLSELNINTDEVKNIVVSELLNKKVKFKHAILILKIENNITKRKKTDASWIKVINKTKS